ncbi:MBL fold metallo-hydrolase [Orrella marina]|uniref:Zn-dependent hydrolase n=1 Tax=Orrella marina TaxID=2163011 RepID=A0A2R4XPW0_9BURK|nr:MBL fold metallo-hydrolase [Orrella marina]AWB35846.1 Zn-dependent hydrolase [Orrella marina]
MNPLEHKLTYPLDKQLPEPGRSLELAPGVRWIKMPLPFALDHINLWLLRDNIDGQDGWTIVDCGVTRDEIKEQWEQVFVNELDGLPVLRVIVTHMHPDHIGLAHWLCERWNVPLWISMTDYVTACYWTTSTGGSSNGGQATVDHFSKHGLRVPETLEEIRARKSYYVGLVPRVPAKFVRIMDGHQIDIGGHKWEAIVGYGHSPEHMSLFCADKKVLISGDMVLPRISTNVSVPNYEPEANPLQLYLSSLDRYQPLPEDTLVLPSHGRPFKGLHERIAQQHQHHQERFDEVLTACVTPLSAFEILPIMFKRKLDTHQTTFAMGEAIAHLNALYFRGKLSRTLSDDGIYLFKTL